MGALISEFELSVALPISTRSVQRRAEKEDRPVVKKRAQGGSKRFYMFDLLPDEVKARIAEECNRRRL